ncbi:hypothetical protein Pst134EA_005048 [Puccinia striiformis f. sp. tritici]|uniref:hypothetical protein n=1 Tax=Puccinia striiformis f. sp. tritici TaxID=168172 RepID=UPI002008D020|nr:hypothetical protein Pst134EA_005048 [Puccinia striiformis f. sp. tritici]KAH9471139.1 hypothetical protein Pst134EA_005048 [Puccinia striiformis f. sp. tritici]
MGKNSCTSTLKNLLSKTTVHNELQVQPPMKLSKLTDNPLIPTLTRGTEAEQQIDSSEPKPRSKKRTLSQSKTIYAGDSQGEKRAQDVVDTHQIQDPDYERLVPEIKLAGMIIQILPHDLIVALPRPPTANRTCTNHQNFFILHSTIKWPSQRGRRWGWRADW